MTPATDPANNPATDPATDPANGQGRQGARFRGEAAGQRPSTPANAQTRLLKGASTLQSSPRSPAALRYSLAHRLTDRDRAIVCEVARHRVLTAGHVAALFFDSRHRALVRLRTLTELGLLDRFRLLARPGESNEYHYVLARAGAATAAAARGQDPEAAARRWRADTALALAAGQRLAHAVGISGFYADLASEARRSEGTRLVEWMTEHEAALWSDRLVRPDGFGVWTEGGRRVEFFLEFDRGTETLRRLVSKLDGYEAFEAERGAAAWVLFVFPSLGRDAEARRAMAGSTVPVATAVLGGGRRPHGPVWRPLSARCDEPPLRLARLADAAIPAEALARAAAGSTRAWRYERSRPDDDEEAPIE